MTTYRFTQVDVFGTGPLSGNPLAVVHDAHGLTSEQMQAFARWTNLSETVFLLPATSPDADYRVRIFTPLEELPFAGHPTLGSAHAWLTAGGSPRHSSVVVQECGIGEIPIRVSPESLAFCAPPLSRSGAVDQGTLERIFDALSLTSRDVVGSNWIANGPNWIGLLLHSAQAVLDLSPDFDALGDLEVAVIGPYTKGSAERRAGIDYELRAFVPGVGINEDPVTGSANAGMASWLIPAGKLPPKYSVRQGTVVGSDGRLRVECAQGQMWVGGAVRTVTSGTVEL
ncbi:PhzF family phenazine biosynthesis protein [Timonella senegalensis]|uniref:PhzF family phenazine biosynthesis protein n=1 Tax=Timonella senegalensis TaxID=1465825 RepID=UPI00031F04BF|nr:PhzF family phenazine biosynthesis protein [Timonella senegalensis]